MAKGSKIVLITEQLEQCLQELQDKSLFNYFSSEVNQRIYYIAGFLCHAGQKERDRRAAKTQLGACIGAVSTHFASEPSEVERLKAELPQDLYKYIDEKTTYGGLKYPNLQFYSLVAKMEYCYSNLAVPSNLKTFGGIVINTICTEIAYHSTFVDHFASLFEEDQFDGLTIRRGLEYYVKVFANLRIQELCRKYNSQLHKTTTGTFRSSIATKFGKKSKLERRKRTAQEELEEELTEDQLHDHLMNIAVTAVVDEDDEE